MKHPSKYLGLVMALMLTPFAVLARACAPKGADAINTNGEHDGGYSRKAEVDITSAHLLLTPGTDPASQVKLCTAALEPCGTAYDTTAAGAWVDVQRLTAGKTRTVIGSKAIAAGARVYATAGGKVTDAVVSNAYLVGKAIGPCSGDGVEFEIEPCFPVKNP